MNYYRRSDVKRAILDFARAGNGTAVRECAFFNRRTKSVQRYLTSEDAERGRPVVFDSEATIELALRAGATAFYASYWRYAQPREPHHSLGHDLVWTIRSTNGGLNFAKKVTIAVLDALSDGGLSEPWVKYSGELGFDLIIPLEAIPYDAGFDNVEVLSDIQGTLTRYIAGYLIERCSSFCIDATGPQIIVKMGLDTCLLSELRLRRGLLLAPMSLNPKSGLVSLPLAPEQVANFSVLDASPVDAAMHDWKIPPCTAHELLKFTQGQLDAAVEATAP
ncbi:MAG: hypothetical protein QMC89_01300 [Candidatus Hodarchaeaceae archaeon]|nr:hypothetical protein [Candidatus Hodarchaeaceae archaeon]